MSNDISVIEDDDGSLGMMQQAPTASLAIQLASAVLDRRIATARTYPRSISRFKQEASLLLTNDVETARGCEYEKPVGGGKVKGPSIRLMEILAMCWGNLEVEISEPIVGDKSVTVKATAWDLQRNYRQEAIATGSILNKEGKRFANHMVETTILAVAAKAKRNAIAAVIPRVYVNELLAVARDVAKKTERSLEEVRSTMVEYFARTYRVSADQICKLLEIEGIDDITYDHVVTLRGVAEAIKEGSPIEEFFGEPPAESKTDAVKKRIAEKKGKQSPAPPPQSPPLSDGKLFPEQPGLPD